MGELILLRHGETEWSRDGRHTGRTDVPLTPKGEAAAAALVPAVAARTVVAAFTSPARRAVHTAELAGLSGAIEVFGPNGRLVGGFLPTHGFTAILIALVANLSVVGIAIVGLFFGGLASAALYLPVMAGLPSAAIDIINAAIALFITAKSDWLDKWLRVGRASS